jgi:hypothetical protein
MASSAEHPTLTLVDRVDRVLVKFDQDFIERRLQEHKQRQEQQTPALCEGIIDELAGELRARSVNTRRLVAPTLLTIERCRR